MSPVFLNPAARTQMLAPAVLAILCTLLAIAGASLIVTWYPYAFSSAEWRFAAAGQFLATLPQTALMLVVLALSAVLTGHYTVLRWAAIIALVVGAATLLILPFFGLDFLTGRHFQKVDAIGAFTREGMRLGATGGVLSLVMIWGGRRALLASIRDTMELTEKGHGLIVGQGEQVQ